MAAEFKISRFKHTWKGQWAASTVYNPDDIVSVAGKVYNCLERHTADTVFYTDLLYQNNDVPPINVPKWELVADGTRFAGEWAVDTEYFIGDIVTIGGATYVCVEGHFSAATPEEFENDLNVEGYWTIFFNGANWTNDWAIETLYQVGDVVKLSGKVYICTEAHTSFAVENPGLLEDIDKWDEFLSNINWLGDWTTGQIYYPNDVVRYGGIVYKCITQHGSSGSLNSGLEADQTKWTVLHSGIEFKGAWSDAEVRYKINDVVKYGAYLYICTTHHATVIGTLFNDAYWSVYCPGNEYQSTWASTTLYQPGDVVRHGGYLFVSNTTNINSQPNYDQGSTPEDWTTFFRGTRIRGEWAFTETYNVGDVVRRQGQLYIAQRNISTGTDVDIIGDGSSINPDNWELLVSGVNWKAFWNEDTDYLIGDLVQWKGAAFRCLERHIAIEANRPDNALGTFWEQYTYGDPLNVLAYVGDLKKFGTVDTASIPVGDSGQALAVINSQPDWKSFNASNKLYYVSLSGIDDPTRGTTLNSAWRTVRYALDNITGPATVIVKTGIYDEILPLRIPDSVAVVGDELRGTIIRVAENYFSPADIDQYSLIIGFINTFIDEVIRGISITFRYGQLKQTTSGAVGTPSEVSLVLDNLDIIDSVLLGGIAPTYDSTNTISIDADVLGAANQINNNKAFVTSEVRAWLDSEYPGYVYEESVLESAVNRICDALVYDLRYPGNYKSVQTGVFFYNGSDATANALENMFLFGNATGLRNMTLRGLNGTLGALNANLTQRPTAGAYASLDPGWGQADESVWIVGRSPYIQNVTTFGTGCVGLKVDGDLHNSGFKTIVANDFTQILSDGIGAWCNGEGASELVSIFTYYNHIGYLCTNGGKIRGTNGNCSYGKFGAVAEGFNLIETPITAVVNNRYYDATVGQTFTDGSNIVKMFYNNAGQEYTSATYTFAGAGINASVLADEFRDGGVYEVRLANLDDSTSALGSGFTLSINNAQAGDPYQVTAAATTDEVPETFRGLRIVIQSGTGAGQYGYIADYDNVSKIILVGNEFYVGSTATTAVAATDIITLSTSAELQVGDAICFTGTVFGGVSDNTVYIIKTIDSNDITLDDGFGGTLPLSNASGTMTVHRLGWGHFQPGTTPLASLDTTTSYFIEPRVVFAPPPITATTGGMSSAAFWSSVTYGEGKFVAVSNGNGLGSTAGGYSTDGGTTWQAMILPSAVWRAVAYGNGTFVAVASDGKAARSADGITWSLGTIPAAEYSAVTYGNGVWVAVAKAGRNSARSTDDGVTWTQVLLPEGADWSDIAFGKNTFVAVAESDSNLTNTAYSTNNGASWTLGSFVGGCKSIAYGNNRFVAIAGGYAGANDAFISFDGIVWTATSIPAANWQSVAYGQGLFVAIARFDDLAATSTDGKYWSLVDMAIADEARDVVFGNYDNEPTFVGVFSATYDVMNLKIGVRAQGRVVLDSNRMTNLRIWEPGSGYTTAPALTIVDPNNTSDATTIVRIANGVLGNPTILNAGAGWVTTSTRVTLSGDGFTDLYQVGNALIVDNATRIPSPGDNLNINGINDYTYKVLNATVLSGTVGNYRLRITIAKGLNSNESPEHNTSLTIRQKYSQVRLTGHDFLDIGLGNFEQTNYPNTLFPVGTILAPENEIDEFAGGRVFYTSTDQDGNFRVGELFAVEQATGTVTISAEFFELQGLEEISIGGVTVGGSGVVIREFSTDPLFVADSNNIIPTQRAIKSYISRRVSGGGSDAFTTTFTAGIVRVGPTSITTTTLAPITIPVNVQFNGIVTGSFLAQAMFMTGDGFTEQF